MAEYFIVLSIFGIGLGLFLAIRGFQGDGLGPLALIAVGLFMMIKEILDIVNSKG
jgi:hypothetical protein